MTEKQFSLHVKTWLAHNKNHFEIDIVDERITSYQIRPFSSKRNLFDSPKNKPLSKLISLKNSSTFPQRQLISCSSEVSISEIEIIGLQPPVHFGHHFFLFACPNLTAQLKNWKLFELYILPKKKDVVVAGRGVPTSYRFSFNDDSSGLFFVGLLPQEKKPRARILLLSSSENHFLRNVNYKCVPLRSRLLNFWITLTGPTSSVGIWRDAGCKWGINLG